MARPARKSTPTDLPPSRDDELCHDEDIVKQVRDVCKDVEKGFRAQWERGNDQLDYWDAFDCQLGGKQAYAGNSQIYVPIVHEAVEARKTRFVNQVFPRSARNVECISSDEKPYDIMALLEHYIRKTKLRTQVVPALVKNGDIEGQYNLYVSWENSERHIAYRSKSKMEIEGEQVEDTEAEADDVTEDVTYHMAPTVEVLADCDVLVLPHTSDSVGHAFANGGSVTVLRRWSKARLERAIDEEEVDGKEGSAALEELKKSASDPNQPNASKKHVDAAGITTGEGGTHLVQYEVWTRLKLKEGRRLCRIYYAGGDSERILSVKRNPNWNDKCPVLSAAVDKISGVFKGQSKLKHCVDLQYAANDAVNEGWDSAAYALLPIVMTDPAKNPRVGSMVMNLAAIWETNPKDTQFAQFPQLWKDAFALVQSAKTEIFQVLSVSPAAIAQSTGAKQKRNQAEIAAEQQVDILSTADVCTNLEDEILTPLLRWFVELDHQHRDKPLTVRQYGQMGIRAAMQDVSIIQVDRRFEFRWFGVEAARNAQQMQMQIAAINVIKGIPPQQYQGYELNAVPFISQLIENTFGPRLAPEIFKDLKSKLSLDAQTENEFLIEGLALPVHQLDDDREHMQAHLQAMQGGDPTGAVREHLMYHRMQMEKKMQVQMASMAQMQRGPGGPPGQGGPPGGGPQPRQGAVAGPSRGGQGPPGMVHQDRLQGPGVVPRR